MNDRFFKWMFYLGAIWNVAGGVAILLLPDVLFTRQGLAAPDPAPYYHSWIALFMVFGVGYYMVARSPHENRNIVILGMVGKIAFAAIFVVHMVLHQDRIPSLFVIPVVGDLLFAFLFALFLVSGPDARAGARASTRVQAPPEYPELLSLSQITLPAPARRRRKPIQRGVATKDAYRSRAADDRGSSSGVSRSGVSSARAV